MTLAELEVIRNLLDMAADRGVTLTKVKLGEDCVEFAAPVAQQPEPALPPVVLPQVQPWQPPQPAVRPQGITHPSLWRDGQLPSFPTPIKD